MATFTFTYEYTSSFNGVNYAVTNITGSSQITVSNNNNSNVFNVGESITITYPDGATFTDTIAAFTTDGIITDSAGAYYLLSTSRLYESGDVLDTNTNPFPVCFVKGTLIETEAGVVAVESLVIGDKVVGSHGLGTVKWVGWRHYNALFLNTEAKRTACMPVRILVGALGDNLPSQDLRVSPWHHLLVDGVLVRANDLINGISIFQETNTTEFSYYHVELEQFDVIQAYGVYSESYADGGNRDFFQNVDVTTLRAEDKKRRLAERPGFTVLRKPADIAVIQARIAARAEACFGMSQAA